MHIAFRHPERTAWDLWDFRFGRRPAVV